MVHQRRGFTLVELLVVVVIVLAISVVALPTVINALGERQMGEAARLVQASLAGARDAAIHANAPRGIRLLPDPAFPLIRLSNGQIDPSQPLASSRLVPLETAPDYSEGKIEYYAPATHAWTNGTPPPYPGSRGTAPYGFYPVPFNVGATPYDLRWIDPAGRLHSPNVLCVVESLRDPNGLPQPPTSWFWNVRVGDKIRIADSINYKFVGTVVGPMTIGPAGGNTEMFVNDGPAGTIPQLNKAGQPAEYLFLVDDLDDPDVDGTTDGFVDGGWDGVDNNRAFGIDDLDEWEHETWNPPPLNGRANLSYTILRRPVPSSVVRETQLPSSIVVDLTTWNLTRERSRLPVNPWTGNVDIMLNINGLVIPDAAGYSSPSRVGLDGVFYHFWLADRGDVATPATGLGISLLPMPASSPGYTAAALLKQTQTLVTLFPRTGRTAITSDLKFDAVVDAQSMRFGLETPFLAGQQGAQ
jgi:prepilin-type N-terminal cleavage/methylation domain-containing protein